MLKHSYIIANLSLDEKLSILTNGAFFSQPPEGLPVFSMTDTDTLNHSSENMVYPSFQGLVNTWDVKAVNYVAKQMAKRALEAEAPAVFLPKANVRSSAYSDGASEDPCLLGSMLGEYAKTMEEYGVTPVLSPCALSNLDVEYADVTPDARALVEYHLNAFRIAARNKNRFAVATSYTDLKGEYKKINVDFIREFLQNAFSVKKPFLLCENNRADSELSCLKAGYTLCLNSDASVLKEAVSYHKALIEMVESGDSSVEELEAAIEEGSALSEDTVDEAVDSVLDFVLGCIQYAKANNKRVELATEKKTLPIAEASAVLLKNSENILPLRSDKRVALIGQIAKAEIGNSLIQYIQRYSSRYMGYEDGYDLTQNYNKQLLNSAKELAKRSDIIVLFVGVGKQREETLCKTKCVQLPGCQMALLEELATLKKKIVVVVKGSGRVDMRFDALADAVMYTPDMGTYGGQALANLLYGKTSPSGRLPFTMYENADERMQRERFYKNNGYNKVGKFVGYRRYDSDGERVKYHFGYGLSYTKFRYSNLRISGGQIYLTVQNVGQRAGTTVVQFYYGKTKSTDPTPKKELFDADIVTLSAGQSITIRKKIEDGNFATYNPEMQKWEMGQKSIRIYAGQSVADDRLHCDYNILSAKETKYKESIAEYLQGKSNIQVGGYFMDTKTKQEKYKDIVTPLGIIAIILGIIGDLFLVIFSEQWRFFRDIIGKWTMGILLFLFNVMLILGFVGVISEQGKKAEYKKKQAQRVALKRKPNPQEKVAQPAPYASLFLQEFKEVEEEEEEKTEDGEVKEKSFVVKEETDEYHKVGWSLEAMRDELVAFLASRGIVLDQENARALLSAMSVSRLVIIQTEMGANRAAFIRAINEFFANGQYVDDASSYTTSDDLFYQMQGTFCQMSHFAAVLDEAKDDAMALKLAHLVNVDATTFGGYMTQLMRYIVKPDIAHTVTARNKSVCDKVFTLKTNLWIMACLEEGMLVDELPAYIAEAAAFVQLRFTETEVQAEEMDIFVRQPISVKQFTSMAQKACFDFELDEKQWKRVDKLEEFVQARTHYHISNKLWQKMENYASVFLALGGEPEQALDSVVASKMLLTVLTLVRNNRKEEDDLFIHTVENIFGDEKSDLCRMLLDASAVDLSDASRQEELDKIAYRKAVRLGQIVIEDENANVIAEVDVDLETDDTFVPVMAETEEFAAFEPVETAELVEPETIETAELVEPETVETAELVEPETVETAELVEPEAVETAEIVEPETVETAEIVEPETEETTQTNDAEGENV